jgi:lipoprotein-anchoring transpeptidase ErfK/SrfK
MELRTRSCTLLTVGLGAALAGCGGEEPNAPARVAVPAPAPVATAPRCSPIDHEPLGTATTAYAAAARRPLTVYDAPGGTVVERFGRLNANGVTTVFGVLGRRVGEDCEPSWYRVRLPRRPNGRVGWVRARAVSLGTVRTRVLVELSKRRVTLYRGAREVISTRAAIGSSATPTPTGTYYVDQRLLTTDPGGPFGPGAVGIAAYSEVLTGWAQGGPIAIHGTNRPDLIGEAVSNGCIRVRNDVLLRIFAATPEGTPVEIQR